MGRAYSGNLIALYGATESVQRLGLRVEEEMWRDTARFRDVHTLRVLTESREVITEKVFDAYDEDVRCNDMTAWLNSVYNDLKDWK